MKFSNVNPLIVRMGRGGEGGGGDCCLTTSSSSYFVSHFQLLKAQLLSNYKDVTGLLSHSITKSLRGSLAISAILPLFVDRFERLIKKPLMMVIGVKKLSFFGPVDLIFISYL